MPLAYLFDENQRGVLWQLVQRHNALVIDPLDVVRVGDVEDLPLGSADSTLLSWAEHLAAGRHSPGILMVSRSARPVDVLEFLVLAAYASDGSESRDGIRYIP